MDENLSPITPPTFQRSPKKNTLIILVAVMIFVSILSVGYFWYQNKQISVPVKNQNLTVASSTNGFADWKTYKDEKYGFEFKYPATYTQSRVDTRHMPQFYGESKVSFYVIPNFLTNDGHVVANVAEAFKMVDKKKIGNFEWGIDRSVDNSYDVGGYKIVYSTKIDGLMVSFALTSFPNTIQTNELENILASFSLTKLTYRRLDKIIGNLKVGDTNGSFVVSKIEPSNDNYGISADNVSVHYNGEVNLVGKILVYDSDNGDFCVNLNKESIDKLPILDESGYIGLWRVCFNTKKTINKDVDEADLVLVSVKDLVVEYGAGGIGLEANLVNIQPYFSSNIVH